MIPPSRKARKAGASWPVALAVTLTVVAESPASAQAPPNCTAKLIAKLTPDVPDPRAPSFLDSLAADPLFKLYWVRPSGTSVVLELVGPGPEYRCQNEISRIRKDGRIVSLRILPQG